MPLPRHRPKPALAALLVAVALVAAACGGGDKGGRGQVVDTLPAPTTVPPIFPLTGLPAGDAAKLARPAVAVKIDNISVARPQAGLDKADVVYEEVTEGITRFIVVFQSTDATSIGPVRSVRPADPLVVKPLGGLLAFSGGAPAIVDLVKAASVPTVTENDTDTLKRRSDRSAPHNLYTSTEALYRKAKADAKAPPKLATFRAAGTPFTGAGAVPTTKIALAPAPGVRAGYDFDAASGTYKRTTDGTPHLVEGGGQVAPANVIVQFTTYNPFDKDPKVSVPQVIGSGDATFFSGGVMVKGRWSKPGVDSVTNYTDATGAAIALAPGPTWVQLQAPGSSITTS
jgi:hypothetical protein